MPRVGLTQPEPEPLPLWLAAALTAHRGPWCAADLPAGAYGARPSQVVAHHASLDQAPDMYDRFGRRADGIVKVCSIADNGAGSWPGLADGRARHFGFLASRALGAFRSYLMPSRRMRKQASAAPSAAGAP